MEKLKPNFWQHSILIACMLLTLILFTYSKSASAFLEKASEPTTGQINNQSLIYVSITKNGFEPELATISVGTTVIWTNYLKDPVYLNSAWQYTTYIPLMIGIPEGSKVSSNPDTIISQHPVAEPQHRNWFSPHLLEPGASFTYKFNAVGDYPVQADSEGFIVGMIKVTTETIAPPASTPTSPTLEPTLTATTRPSSTPSPTAQPTATPTTSATQTPAATATTTTATPTSEPTKADLPSTPSTGTPQPTATHTASPTATNTPSPTETATVTPSPTATETNLPPATQTITPSPTVEIKQKLQVVLFTDPADGTNITFELDRSTQFMLDSDEVETNDNDSIEHIATFNELEVDEHTLALIEPSNFALESVTCISNMSDNIVSIADSNVSFTLRPGESLTCEFRMLKDSDFDRLPDIYETDTQVYVSPTNTGTSPYNRDTDSDGILDGAEVIGTIQGLDLPGMGANPLRKTIFVEYDWVEDNLKNNGYCGVQGSYHSHRPSQAVMENAAAVYANAPVSNPDGSNGIDLIQDYGQGGLFTGGSMLFRNGSGLIVGSVDDPMFRNLKAANFDTKRKGYFHYAIFAHQYYSAESFSSGQAEIGGDDIIVSVYNYYCADQISAFATVHELGHNMGLRHGGHENREHKPNYNSVMNYRFQFSGIDSNDSCDGQGDGINGYSTGWRVDLNELDLNEAEGVCGLNSTAIDWNNNQNWADNDIAWDVNNDGQYNVLQDHDDWGNLYYLGPLEDLDLRGPRTMLFREVELSQEPPIPNLPYFLLENGIEAD